MRMEGTARVRMGEKGWEADTGCGEGTKMRRGQRERRNGGENKMLLQSEIE